MSAMSVVLTVLELLIFNPQKHRSSRRSSRDPGHAPFPEKLRCYVRTESGHMLVKFDVRSLNHFGAITISRPKI